MRPINLSIWYLATGLTVSILRAAPLCPPLPPNVESAGHILTVIGTWRLKSMPQAELQAGCQLAPGAEITPPSPFATGYAKIAILERSGNLRARTCNANEDCAPPLFMPNNPVPRQGIWASLVEEIMRKLRSDPDTFVSAITLGDGQLNDAIVQQSAAGIDFSRVLRGLAPGKYELEFTRLVKLPWDGNTVKVDPSTLGTGLYQVHLKGHDSRDAAWVLIVRSGPSADEVTKGEVELRAVMSSWTDNADIERRNARRTLYRAFLAQAAEKSNAPGQ